MNDKLQAVLTRLKNGKLILILGILGVVLILLSGLAPKETQSVVTADNFDAVVYQQQLEKDIEKLVKDITSCRATVVITLDSDIKYNYADETKISDSMRESDTATDKSSDGEKNRVIITDSSGNQKALVVNRELPQIRGVAVVYDGANNELTNEKIKNCLMATLSVTSKRIYISGKGGK